MTEAGSAVGAGKFSNGRLRESLESSGDAVAVALIMVILVCEFPSEMKLNLFFLFVISSLGVITLVVCKMRRAGEYQMRMRR